MDFPTRFGDKVLRCERIIGYTFRSSALCAQAINAAGDLRATCLVNGDHQQIPKNDRLAIYGNIAMNHYLCELWLNKNLEKGQ